MSSAERERRFDDDSEREAAPKTASEHFVSALPGTENRISWLLIGTGVVFVLAGQFVATGELTGLLGLWGLSLIVAVLLARGAYALWYALG